MVANYPKFVPEPDVPGWSNNIPTTYNIVVSAVCTNNIKVLKILSSWSTSFNLCTLLAITTVIAFHQVLKIKEYSIFWLAVNAIEWLFCLGA